MNTRFDMLANVSLASVAHFIIRHSWCAFGSCVTRCRLYCPVSVVCKSALKKSSRSDGSVTDTSSKCTTAVHNLAPQEMYCIHVY